MKIKKLNLELGRKFFNQSAKITAQYKVVLERIAEQEQIKVDEEEITQSIKVLMDGYANSGVDVSNNNIRSYVEKT